MKMVLVIMLLNVINCFPSFKPDKFQNVADKVEKKDFGEVQDLVDENFLFDSNFDDQERLRNRLIQLLIYVLDNKNIEGENGADMEKMRKIREIINSNLENLNLLDKLDKIRSINKPLKNEHRHVFIG